jgi:DNA-binding response OmpR family regulator
MAASRILVVDDDSSIRKFVKINLEARGYQVFAAADGKEAVLIAEKVKPEMLILDIVMPGIDGYAVCRRIREWSNIPIIMFSAQEVESAQEKCSACGATEYLTKPFVLKELLARVKALLKPK